MTKEESFKAVAVARVGLLSLLLGSSIVLADGDDDRRANLPVPSTGAVPKAQCGPGDRTEGGLQGQTTPAERASGDSQNGYNCNLELVSQFRGEGAVSQNGPTYFNECAYFATNNSPQQQHRGVVVLDVSDTAHPVASEYLDDTPAMANPHETLRANAPRKLLAAAQNNGPDFAVYDLSADCRKPTLKGEIQLAGARRIWATRAGRSHVLR
jgi:hypothetical protein